MRTRALRSTRFSRRQSVGGEARGAVRGGRAPGGDLQRRVDAQGLMVVEVLVAQGQGGDPLGEHGALVVADRLGLARVGDRFGEGPEEPEGALDLAQQQGAGIGGEAPAAEVGDDLLGAEAGKAQGGVGTVCHSDGLAFLGDWIVLTQTLQGVRPSRN